MVTIRFSTPDTIAGLFWLFLLFSNTSSWNVCVCAFQVYAMAYIQQWTLFNRSVIELSQCLTGYLEWGESHLLWSQRTRIASHKMSVYNMHNRTLPQNHSNRKNNTSPHFPEEMAGFCLGCPRCLLVCYSYFKRKSPDLTRTDEDWCGWPLAGSMSFRSCGVLTEMYWM